MLVTFWDSSSRVEALCKILVHMLGRMVLRWRCRMRLMRCKSLRSASSRKALPQPFPFSPRRSHRQLNVSSFLVHYHAHMVNDLLTISTYWKLSPFRVWTISPIRACSCSSLPLCAHVAKPNRIHQLSWLQILATIRLLSGLCWRCLRPERLTCNAVWKHALSG